MKFRRSIQIIFGILFRLFLWSLLVISYLLLFLFILGY
jgi:hypothetical protein